MKKIGLPSLLALSTVIIATPYFVDFITERVFDWTLLQKTNSIAAQQNKRKIELDTVLGAMLTKLDFSCSGKDQQLLQSSALNSRYIMLLGVITNQGQTCSSLGDRVIFSLNKETGSTAIDDNVHFINPGKLPSGANNLIFTYKKPKGMLFSILGSDSFYNLLDEQCDACFYVEFIVNNKIVFSVGDSTIKSEVTHKSTFHEIKNDHTVAVRTYAGKALLTNVRASVRRAFFIFMAISGGLLLAFFAVVKFKQKNLYHRLNKAMKNDELKLHYQPVFDLSLNKFVGAEVLIRWRHNDEWISPAQFIPYAEEKGLIIPITDYLIKKTISETDSISNDLWYSINISAKHFFEDQLLQSIDKVNITDPGRFFFELTERHPIKNIEAAKKQIKTLEKDGYHFKLDDFGTGYGGVAYLQTLGIRALKIDKMFVDTIGTDDFKLGVLESIIAFGLESNYELIAEGVETKEQADFLYAKGVTLHQGYFYAKPMNITQLAEKLNQHAAAS